MSFSERRQFPRFPFHSRGALDFVNAERQGTVLDVSLKGALFRTEDPLETLSGNFCALKVSRFGWPAFHVAMARIAYQRRNFLGLEFIELSNDARMFLGEVMNMNLAVDSLLDRDLPEMLAPESS